ncbi:hypothetical protein N44_02604 [Microcystis aeruginosa NIES-44]|uniref:Uncharacterized protein n=1 Tax=Microcystis aeruginosa NIES-44 TaxID=449439 RepID=A0A0A1VWS5_MICAE|nr:hypothetical protein N44_02604 [Microcystis aeruginosa NIES-44]
MIHESTYKARRFEKFSDIYSEKSTKNVARQGLERMTFERMKPL